MEELSSSNSELLICAVPAVKTEISSKTSFKADNCPSVYWEGISLSGTEPIAEIRGRRKSERKLIAVRMIMSDFTLVVKEVEGIPVVIPDVSFRVPEEVCLVVFSIFRMQGYTSNS